MTVETSLRTKDLARAVGVSTQLVRNYEAAGFIPPVERSPSGYRRYTARHLAAMRAARALIGAYGWERARAIMAAVGGGKLPDALALINERHAELDRTRLQLDETLAALAVLTTGLPAAPALRPAARLRVGAAARLVGARVSALRFWEERGLLEPTREAGSRYRLYDERQLRRLRIVALLREADHDFPAIRLVLDELEAGRPGRAVAAVEARRGDLAAQSWRCVEALTLFHAYVREFGEGATL